jgi:predicted ester cyclase
MTVDIHDIVAAGGKVAIRATYQAPTQADSSRTCRLPENFEMEAMYMVRINEGQIVEHWGVIDTIGTMGQLGLLPPQG